MKSFYYIMLSLVAGTLALTVTVVMQTLLFGLKPSPFLITGLAFNWFMMIKYNWVYQELWEKFKNRRK
jgi:predicted membrane chloride channel (bestrophin family)